MRIEIISFNVEQLNWINILKIVEATWMKVYTLITWFRRSMYYENLFIRMTLGNSIKKRNIIMI